MRAWAVAVALAWQTSSAAAAEPLVVVGPALGTTYRVTLAALPTDMPLAAVHREIDRRLARVDRSISTWRPDADAARFNRAAAGEWVEIGPDLAALLAVAGQVHEQSQGAFDSTAGPLVRLWRGDEPPSAAAIAAARARVGMDLVEVRDASGGLPAAIRKTVPGVELDLDGIGPGYAVDALGTRLGDLGSPGHLVELGGEVRAWGVRADGSPWRVRLRGRGDRTIALEPGLALATATAGAGRAVVDPRTGTAARGAARSVTVLAGSCAAADAWAVAAVVLDLPPAPDGLVRPAPAAIKDGPAPSTKAAPPGATRAAP